MILINLKYKTIQWYALPCKLQSQAQIQVLIGIIIIIINFLKFHLKITIKFLRNIKKSLWPLWLSSPMEVDLHLKPKNLLLLIWDTNLKDLWDQKRFTKWHRLSIKRLSNFQEKVIFCNSDIRILTKNVMTSKN
jgi:energy-coupling factor transporter transmembrane protein EcfT